MAFDVEGALKAGYSEQEIAQFLGAQRKFDTQAALASGYSPREVIDHLAQAEAKPTTIGGQFKEALKGIPSGAIGMLESAATGASALLPDDMEAGAREKIKSVATAAKAPFAAEAGYEESIGRKGGEALGSTVPFFAAGPLGAAGRVAAGTMALGAGAGEARVRAEQGGASEGQRAGATALGAAVGATEMLPVFKFISTLGKPLADGIASQIRRALATGGAEAAQEAAANIAQNLIAKGLYKPEQAAIEGAGEAAAYGGGVGALIQGLTDMALGRRAKGVQTTPPKPPTEAPAPAVEEAPAKPAEEVSVDDLILQREALKKQPYTKDTRRQIQELSKQIDTLFKARSADETQRLKERGTPMPSDIGKGPAAKSAEAFMGEQLEIPMPRERVLEPLPPETDLFGEPLRPKAKQTEGLADVIGAELPATTEVLQDAGLAPTQKELEAAGQQRLPLRRTPEGQPTTTEPVVSKPATVAPQAPLPAGVAEPKLRAPAAPVTPETVPPVVGDDTFKALGIGSTANIRSSPLAGMDITKPEDAAQVKRDLTVYREASKSDRIKANIDAYLGRPEFQGLPDAAPTTPTTVEPKPAAQLRRSEPSVAVSGEPTGAPSGAAPATGEPAAPVGRGLVPAGQPAESGVSVEGAPSPTLTPEEEAAAAQKEREEYAALQAKLAAQKDKRRGVRAAEPAPAKPAAPVEQPTLEEDRYLEPESIYQDEDGAVLRRSPQGTLLPTTEKEGVNLVKARERAAKAAPAVEAEPTAQAADERQRELDFTAKPKATNPKAAKTKAPPTSTEVEEAPVSDTVEPSAAEMQAAIEGKPLIEVAQWVAENLPKGYQKLIARRVLQLMKQAEQSGITFLPLRVTKDGNRLSSGARGVTFLNAKAKERAATVEVTLNHPSNGANSGVNPVTVLHELVHAATTAIIQLGQYKSNRGSELGTKTRELQALHDAVIDHFNKRVRSGDELTAFEQAMAKQQNNAMVNMYETLAWGLTSPDAQAYLETIPYKGTTVWNKFVTMIRDLLGLPAKADTALAELLRVSDRLFDVKAPEIEAARVQSGFQYETKKQEQVDPVLMGQAQQLIPQDIGAVRKMQNAVATLTGKNSTVPLATRIRTSLVDPLATVEQRITNNYDQNVLDAMGGTMATVVTRQAQDVTKLMQAFYDDGSLVVNPKTRMLEVRKGKHAPNDIFPILRDMATDLGLSFEEAFAYTSTVLEGMRLNELVKANTAGATDVLIHWRTPSGAIDTAKIKAAMAEYQSDSRYKQLADIMDAPRIELINELEKSGRLTPEIAKEWRDVAHYVPFDRIKAFETLYSSAKKTSSKGISRFGRLPELAGSEWRPVGNVFENYFKTMGWLSSQLAKQNANSYMMDAMIHAGYASRIYNPKLSKTGLIVNGYEKGIPVTYEVASKWDQMAFADPNGKIPNWVRLFSQIGRVLRATITMNPVFAAKQVVQDVQGALLFSGVKNPLAFTVAAVGNFGKLTWHETVNAYKAARGEATTTHKIDQDMRRLGLSGEVDYTVADPAMEELFRQGVRKRTKLGSTTLGAIVHGLQQITHASDLAVRKALFDDEMRRSNDVLMASTKARELINFRRMGSNQWVQHWSAMVPFFNVGLQATDIVYRTVTSKADPSGLGKKAARNRMLKTMAVYGSGALMYALMRSGDDDYEDMDRRVRDNNWVFPGNLSIPIRGDMALVKVAIENGVDYMRRKGTVEELEAMEAIKTAFHYAFEQYAGRNARLPAAAQPLLENFVNFSFMTGRAQIGTYQQGKPKHLQEVAGTTETAKAIAEFVQAQFGFGISPVHIDNVLRGYLGTTAATLTMMTDAALYPDKVDRPLHKMVAIGAFAWDETQLVNPKNEFYDLQQKVLPPVRAFHDLELTDPEAAEKYAAEHETELMLASTINQTLEELSNIRANEKYLNGPEAAKTMSSEERAAQLLEMKQYANELVQYVREIRHELKI